MKEEDYLKVLSMLDNEEDLESLKRLKVEINKKISEIEDKNKVEINKKISEIEDKNKVVPIDKTDLTDEEFNERIDILTQSFLSFYDENVLNQDRVGFKFKFLYTAYSLENGMHKNFRNIELKDDLKVYQVLGHDRKKIYYYSGISDDVLNKLDTYLKKVGLSLDIKLTGEQLNILTAKTSLIDEEFNEKLDILSQSFLSFYDENVLNQDRVVFRFKSLYTAYSLENGMDKNFRNIELKDDLKVYQVLGHNRKKIYYYNGISDDMLNRLDTYLKKVGLSLDIKLTEEQLNILKDKNKDAIK